MTTEVIRVSPDWLALREPADAAARSEELAQRLARSLAGSESLLRPPVGGGRVAHRPGGGAPLVIHDLGGGSGAMGRWLAPRLPGPQHWVIHDRDADLLSIAAANPPSGAAVTVEARPSDLTVLTPDDLADASAIVASALLDLLTDDELTGLLATVASAGCPLLLALTVVGRVTLTPAEPLNAAIAAAFNAHQRRVTPAGPLLGPDAVAATREALRATGAEVLVRPSPWRLGPADADLTTAWLDGWLAAASEQEPALDLAAYRERRVAQAIAGNLRVTVDHADLLVLP